MERLFESLNQEALISLLAAAIGISVMLAVFALINLLMVRSNPLRRRLAALGSADQIRPDTRTGIFSSAIRPLGAYLLPKREKERETLRLKLIRAGFRSEYAAVNLYLIKTALMFAAPAGAVLWLIQATQIQTVYLIFLGFAITFIGMMLPNIYLNHRIGQRKREMLNALPDALDLLVSCTEAGLGLNAALQRVADNLNISSPLLAAELKQVNAEIRGGMDRILALKNLTYRTGLDEIRGLVSLLSQSLRFGSSVAELLRIYSEEFRDKRMQRAEEQAALVGTKLIFPMCFCIFPSFFLVSVGPAAIRMIAALGTADF